MSENKMVLVTGVAGFIASKTAELLLRQGWTVVGLDNLNDYYDVRLKDYRLSRLLGNDRFLQSKDPAQSIYRAATPESGKQVSADGKFIFYPLDIEKLPELEKLFEEYQFEAVLNLAARAGVRYSMENPFVYMTTNAMGTLNILDCMRKHGVKKHVMASTSSLYAGQKMPFTEDLPVNTPLSPYAASKKAGELMAYSYHKPVSYTHLSASQKEEARRANAELTYTPIALEAFVFFVNKECPIDGLTSQQIRDIYSGKIRNWKELGAPAGRIIAFQRPANSGSQTTMERFMGETPLAKPLKEEVVRSMGSIIERVAQYRDVANAIGYSFRYYASTMKGSDSIKFLKVDGVAPTPENIASRRYPMTGEVLAITSQHSDPECARLIEWILGPQGQELVRKTGYIPINKAAKMPENPSE